MTILNTLIQGESYPQVVVISMLALPALTLTTTIVILWKLIQNLIKILKSKQTKVLWWLGVHRLLAKTVINDENEMIKVLNKISILENEIEIFERKFLSPLSSCKSTTTIFIEDVPNNNAKVKLRSRVSRQVMTSSSSSSSSTSTVTTTTLPVIPSVQPQVGLSVSKGCLGI